MGLLGIPEQSSRPLSLRVPSLRHVVTCPALHDKANALHILLSRHRLPVCDDFEDLPFGFSMSYAKEAESLPPSKLRHSPDLLGQVHRRLEGVASMFAPGHEGSIRSAGPTKEDTERIKECLASLTARSALAARARRHGVKTNPIEYLTRYLFRPLNEILGCMLLSTGLQVYWQLSPDPVHANRFELIYAPANHDHEVLAILDLTTPGTLGDTSMRSLVDSLRCEIVKVDHTGKVVISTPVPPSHRPVSCKLVGKVLGDMVDQDVPVAVVTNCTRFMVIQNPGPTLRGEEAFEFSDLINGTDIPGELLTESPLGLLLGVTVYGLHKRGLSLRANFGLLAHATTTSVLRGFLSERFGKIDQRKSQEIRLKRRAMFEYGMYPSQLGPMSCLFRMPENFYGTISPTTRSSVSSLVNTFHGPCQMDLIPNLMPDAPCSSTWFVPELLFTDFRGKGDLWDVFTARFSWLPSTPADLIVKFCNLTSFFPLQANKYLYSQDEARTALRAEMTCCTGPLRPLQGDIVPKFYGIFGSWQPGNGQWWCVMFEDAGVSLTPGDGVNPDIRLQIRKMYMKLHMFGVVHTDVAWRHILHGPTGLKLISFDRAIMRRLESDKEWEVKCDAEMARLDELLGEGTWSPEPPQSDDCKSELEDGKIEPYVLFPELPYFPKESYITPRSSFTSLRVAETPKKWGIIPARKLASPPPRQWSPLGSPFSLEPSTSPADKGTAAESEAGSYSHKTLRRTSAIPALRLQTDRGLFRRASMLFNFTTPKDSSAPPSPLRSAAR